MSKKKGKGLDVANRAPEVAERTEGRSSWYASAQMTACDDWAEQDPDIYRTLAAPRMAGHAGSQIEEPDVEVVDDDDGLESMSAELTGEFMAELESMLSMSPELLDEEAMVSMGFSGLDAMPAMGIGLSALAALSAAQGGEADDAAAEDEAAVDVEAAAAEEEAAVEEVAVEEVAAAEEAAAAEEVAAEEAAEDIVDEVSLDGIDGIDASDPSDADEPAIDLTSELDAIAELADHVAGVADAQPEPPPSIPLVDPSIGEVPWVGRALLQLDMAPQWLLRIRDRYPQVMSTARTATPLLMPAYELHCGVLPLAAEEGPEERAALPTRIARRLWQRDMESVEV